MLNKDENILDNNFLDIEVVKEKLIKSGIKNFYETNKNVLEVSENDAVRVTVQTNNNSTKTIRNFPQIGNTVQVVSTIILFIISFLASLPFKLIIALLLGQLISFLFHSPKIKRLENDIKEALM